MLHVTGPIACLPPATTPDATSNYPSPPALRAQASACRNVKFGPAPLDLMAFTEHRGRCHKVDSRMWGRRQVGGGVRISPAQNPLIGCL